MPDVHFKVMTIRYLSCFNGDSSFMKQYADCPTSWITVNSDLVEGLAAELAKSKGCARVYIVEPTGSFEDDPNVTNEKFPGNPTRSYRTREPLKIPREARAWSRLTPEQFQQWQEKLANNQGRFLIKGSISYSSAKA
ncbi:hypothetical protein ABIC84_004074 [Mucilaginibacter sp. 3215]